MEDSLFALQLYARSRRMSAERTVRRLKALPTADPECLRAIDSYDGEARAFADVERWALRRRRRRVREHDKENQR